ncbi:MurR/RpiR family transcriptional regulator [Gordonia hongkongensis]|uniref:MurR/RpiR family transcriptional regulator n=1 Tax=Gordonia hongkongensis TaxID=1701090 RepID=UPI003EB89650
MSEASAVTSTTTLAGRGVSAAVRAALPALQPGDARVAQIFLERPQAVVDMSVSETARIADVSTATVVRFAQKLGYKGFHAIKLALAQEIAASPDGRLADVEPTDSALDVLVKVSRAGAQAVLDASTTVSAAALEASVAALLAARSVLFVAVGTSAPVAADAAYRLKTVGIPAEFPADPHVQHVSARLLCPGDVCFVISHTGSTRESLLAVDGARRAGATTIAVTSFASSPLTEVVDHPIVAGAREVAFHLEAVSSRLAHVAVLDALLVAVTLGDPERATDAVALYTEVLSDHRL